VAAKYINEIRNGVKANKAISDMKEISAMSSRYLASRQRAGKKAR